MYSKKIVASIIMVFSFVSPLSGMAGTLDTTFNPAGIEPGTNAIPSSVVDTDIVGQSVAIQSDGKIVVAGTTDTEGFDSYAVVRFNTDGLLDPTFGTAGMKIFSFPGSIDDSAFAVAIQSDGKIVVAGNSIIAGISQFSVARLNTDGTLDTTFNGTGTSIVTGINGNNINNAAYAVAIQPADGKIVLAGYTNTVASTLEFGLARLNTDGTLDTTFNTAGAQQGTAATPSIAGNDVDNEAYSVLIQPADGGIVLAGFANVAGIYEFAVARFLTNGTLDTTFNAGGTVPGTAFTSSVNGLNASNVGYAAALQKNGQIVISGYAYNGTGYELGVARFNANGLIDTTFNGSGSNSTTVANVTTDTALYGGIVIQNNGKIVIAGNVAVTPGTVYQFALARFNSNGSLDTTFDAGGVQPGTVSTYINGNTTGNNQAYALALQADGKLVPAGLVFIDNNELGIARFFGDPITVTTNPCALILMEKYGTP